MAAKVSSEKYLGRMELTLPSPRRAIQAMPLAPKRTASAPSWSITARGKASPPLALMARTTPPLSTHLRNTENEQSRMRSVMSTISMPKRVSGLSVPYKSMACRQVRRGKA